MSRVRPTALRSALLIALLALAQLGSWGHRFLVPHEVCAEHGEVVHGEVGHVEAGHVEAGHRGHASPSPGTSGRGLEVEALPGQELHGDHCAFDLCTPRRPLPAPLAPQLVSASALPARAAGGREPFAAALAVWLLAPKQSPPIEA